MYIYKGTGISSVLLTLSSGGDLTYNNLRSHNPIREAEHCIGSEQDRGLNEHAIYACGICFERSLPSIFYNAADLRAPARNDNMHDSILVFGRGSDIGVSDVYKIQEPRERSIA
jgi:hypothetical protein